MEIGILCSGELGLSTLKVLAQNFTPQFIFTDNNSKDIINFTKEHSIPVHIGNPRKNEPSDFLKQFKTDIIFSINYLFIVKDNLLNHPMLHAINLHGSLLPKYRGRTPHVWAMINGEKETGVTAHIMEADCDTGDIVLQRKIKILKEFTGADILNHYKKLYPEIILKLIEQIKTGELKLLQQNEKHATFFGKRTPGDGQINWNWQKERIYNWVQAQAFPYPGAYTMLNKQRIIIDKIEYSDHGFNYDMPNGLVLNTKPNIAVKTPNGVVVLTQIRNRQTLSINLKEKFESPCE